MNRRIATLLCCAMLCASQAYGQNPIFTPADAVLGGQFDGSQFFNIGTTGTAGNTNNWPGGEPPTAAIDGAGQKYLNFGKLNTGILVTPSVGASVAASLKLWTANDAEERDPASYELWGTNAAIMGSGPFDIADFTQISSGSLDLPSTRNEGGAAALLEENSQTVLFTNTDSFSSYLVYFPTVKSEAAANSMQIAEVQLFGLPDLDATLSVEVNRGSGLVTLKNGTNAPVVDMNSYQVRSEAGSLDPTSWISLADNPDYPAASAPGAGDGWEEGGGVNEFLITEAYLLGSSTIDPGQSVSLGQIFDTSVGVEDLNFRFSRPTGPLGQAPIIYVDGPSITCDFNGNSTCDIDDIDLLIENIAVGPADPATFDLTGDGNVDLADRDAWLAQAGAENLPSGAAYLLADANLDGTVDGEDFLTWNTNKFTTTAAWSAADFNADANVDGGDFLIWNTFKFQSSDSVTAVPEPGSLGLLFGMAISLLVVRRQLVK